MSRTLFSSSPPRNHYGRGSPEEALARDLAEFAERLGRVTQGSPPGSVWKRLYGLIALLQGHGLKPTDVHETSLRNIADAVGVAPDELVAKVVVRWDRMDPARLRLSDALAAARADPGLTDGLPPLDGRLLLLAATCRLMGSTGKPFRLHQRSLFQALGLSNQQAASDMVRALVKYELIRVETAHRYTQKKATEYVWVGAGAVPPPSANAAPAAPPRNPSPPHSSARPPSPPAGRPGHSPVQDEEHLWPSRVFKGGYVEAAHHYAEVVLARKLGRVGPGESLPVDFWHRDRHGQEYARQVDRARQLAVMYGYAAIGKALSRRDAKKVHSLVPEWFEDMVRREHVRIERETRERDEADRARAAQDALPLSGANGKDNDYATPTPEVPF